MSVNRAMTKSVRVAIEHRDVVVDVGHRDLDRRARGAGRVAVVVCLDRECVEALALAVERGVPEFKNVVAVVISQLVRPNCRFVETKSYPRSTIES